MNTEKIYFDNAELDGTALASGTISRYDTKITKVIYSIDSIIADDIGAELFVHEFNEVAIYEVLNRILPYESLSAISHNLNAESDNEYVEERNLLHGYVKSDRLPAIDKVFTQQETDDFRERANKPRQ